MQERLHKAFIENSSTKPLIHLSYPVNKYLYIGKCWYEIRDNDSPELNIEALLGIAVPNLQRLGSGNLKMFPQSAFSGPGQLHGTLSGGSTGYMISFV
jgi:hypothetical protein